MLQLEELTEIRMYRGIERNISICMPSEGIDNIIDALSMLRSDATDFYCLIEEHTRSIQLSEQLPGYANPLKKSTHLSMKVIRKGRIYCAVGLMHEASHNSGIFEEHSCIEKEADCLDALGERYWRELRLGFRYERNAYVGLRKLQMNLGS